MTRAVSKALTIKRDKTVRVHPFQYETNILILEKVLEKKQPHTIYEENMLLVSEIRANPRYDYKSLVYEH